MNAPVKVRRPAPMVYREGEANRCPQCAGAAWIVGRASAQCARCGHPLPLAHGTRVYPVQKREGEGKQ